MEKIIATVLEELNYSYAQSGKSIATETAVSIASRMSDDLRFSDESEVREAFRRAREIQDVPTQRTLSEALRNARAERPKAAVQFEAGASAVTDGRRIRAWLPDNPVMREINANEAVKNLAIAKGEYDSLCRLSVRNGSKERVFGNAFNRYREKMLQEVRTLYRRYARALPMYCGFPAEDDIGNECLIPPTVNDFVFFLQQDAASYA